MTDKPWAQYSAEEQEEYIGAEVATWPELTPERMAELRRLLGPATQRLRRAQAEAVAKDARA